MLNPDARAVIEVTVVLRIFRRLIASRRSPYQLEPPIRAGSTGAAPERSQETYQSDRPGLGRFCPCDRAGPPGPAPLQHSDRHHAWRDLISRTSRLLRRLIPPTPIARRLALQSLLFATAQGAFLTGSAVFFTEVVGLTASKVGLGLTIAGAVSFLVAYPAGKLVDRFGPKRTLGRRHAWKCLGVRVLALGPWLQRIRGAGDRLRDRAERRQCRPSGLRA